jgi:hypothetical protein
MASKNAVDEFMEKLEHPYKAEIEAIRAIILAADERVTERIKWNAPSFYLNDDFATFKLRPTATIQVVLHVGAKVKANPVEMKIDDPSGLLKWAAKDRCVVTFFDREDIASKKTAFVDILRQWIKQI